MTSWTVGLVAVSGRPRAARGTQRDAHQRRLAADEAMRGACPQREPNVAVRLILSPFRSTTITTASPACLAWSAYVYA
jgi:hypothetical protein